MEDPKSSRAPIVISPTVDICYSSDDDEYYFQRYPETGQITNWATFADVSQGFHDLSSAENAYVNGDVRWKL